MKIAIGSNYLAIALILSSALWGCNKRDFSAGKRSENSDSIPTPDQDDVTEEEGSEIDKHDEDEDTGKNESPNPEDSSQIAFTSLDLINGASDQYLDLVEKKSTLPLAGNLNAKNFDEASYALAHFSENCSLVDSGEYGEIPKATDLGIDHHGDYKICVKLHQNRSGEVIFGETSKLAIDFRKIDRFRNADLYDGLSSYESNGSTFHDSQGPHLQGVLGGSRKIAMSAVSGQHTHIILGVQTETDGSFLFDGVDLFNGTLELTYGEALDIDVSEFEGLRFYHYFIDPRPGTLNHSVSIRMVDVNNHYVERTQDFEEIGAGSVRDLDFRFADFNQIESFDLTRVAKVIATFHLQHGAKEIELQDFVFYP